MTQDGISYSYAYNGLGDRLQQTVDSVTTDYTLDLNTGLTQVLTDGTDTYLYGLGRIGEYDSANWTYPLADALGSVRQLTDSNGAPVMAQNYAPYGDVQESYGDATSNYGFAGEWTDGTGLQYLRARYLNTGIGRFISRDTWGGDYNRPMSLNRWGYVAGNPINWTDPSGNMTCPAGSAPIYSEDGDFLYCRKNININFCLFGKDPQTGQCIVPPFLARTTTATKEDALILLLLAACAAAWQAGQNVDIDFDFDRDDSNGWEFYYIEIGDVDLTEFSSYYWVMEKLNNMQSITGVGGLMSHLRSAHQANKDGADNLDLLMGRRYEAERAIVFYNKGKLVSVNTTAQAYDLEVNNWGTIKWIEVKWSNNEVQSNEIRNAVRQARNARIQSGAFLLEATRIRDDDIQWMKKQGGEELPFTYP